MDTEMDLDVTGSCEELEGDVNQDWNLLANIFPEEVWLKILHKVDHAEKHIVRTASVFFDQLLAPSRVSFLFPQVWSVLAPKLEREYLPSFSLKHMGFQFNVNSFPALPINPRQLYPMSSVVHNLRQVCTDWRNAIDGHYENISPLTFDPLQNKPDEYWSCLTFKKPAQIDRFIGIFGASVDNGLNPVLFRHVAFCFMYPGGWVPSDYNQNPEEHMFPLITQFLEIFGHHIWHCNISFVNPPRGRALLFTKVIEWLTHIPNLKTLDLSVDSEDIYRARGNRREEAFPDWPHIPTLRHVDFNCIPIQVMHQFLRRNRQVELVISNYPCVNWGHVSIPGLLHLATYPQSIQEYANLETSKDPNWKLESIKLSFAYCQEFMPWSRVFKFLETWKDSLRHVYLHLPGTSKQSDSDALARDINLRLNLPKVKSLQLIATDYSGIDFILPMKESLEWFKLSWFGYDEDRVSQELEEDVVSNNIITVRRNKEANKKHLPVHMKSLFPRLKWVQFS